MSESFKLPEGNWGVDPECDIFDGSMSVGDCVAVYAEDAIVARVGGDIPHHLNVAQLFRFSRELFALAERVAYHFENQTHPIGDEARALLKKVKGAAAPAAPPLPAHASSARCLGIIPGTADDCSLYAGHTGACRS